MPLPTIRLVVAVLAACLAPLGVAQSASVALQIDEPWNFGPSATTNTGTVGAVPVTAEALRWHSSFNNDSIGYASAFYGSLAAESGTVGDGFTLTMGQGTSDTLTITLGGTLTDPVFVFADMDLVGSTLSVTPGFSAFANNADSAWAGNLLSTLSGTVQGTSGAFGAVQYAGDHAAGSEFSFFFDYSESAPGGSDLVFVGLYIDEDMNGPGPIPDPPGQSPIPEPSAALLLGLGLASLATRRPR